jgi:hypothetical protein
MSQSILMSAAASEFSSVSVQRQAAEWFVTAWGGVVSGRPVYGHGDRAAIAGTACAERARLSRRAAQQCIAIADIGLGKRARPSRRAAQPVRGHHGGRRGRRGELVASAEGSVASGQPAWTHGVASGWPSRSRDAASVRGRCRDDGSPSERRARPSRRAAQRAMAVAECDAASAHRHRRGRCGEPVQLAWRGRVGRSALCVCTANAKGGVASRAGN